MSNSKIVYSTDSNFEVCSDRSEQKSFVAIKEQKIKLYLDRKKGGKITTIIRGLILKNNDIRLAATGEPKARLTFGTVSGCLPPENPALSGQHSNRADQLMQQASDRSNHEAAGDIRQPYSPAFE